MPRPAGTRVDQYELLEHLADGGQAEVHRAKDVGSGIEVVIKFPHARVLESAVLAARWRRQAHLTQALAHPNIHNLDLKLTDFGAATTAAKRHRLWTLPVPPEGTAEYLSPEQVTGHSGDERSDIYGWGVVMYELLTGRVPYTGSDPLAAMEAHLHDTVVPLHQHWVHFPWRRLPGKFRVRERVVYTKFLLVKPSRLGSRSKVLLVEITENYRLQRKTNWWGAFVIGLAAPILVIGLDPPAIQALGAAAVPLLAGATAIGVLLCLFVAELAATMPERTGGVPSYTTAAFEPFGESISRHVGGLAAWSYWLGWFPVAPINMILAAAYITKLFGLPAGHSFLPFGNVGSPISLASIIISVIGIFGMYIPCYLGIKLGAAAATVLGVLSMIPLTLLVLLPIFKPSSMHWHNLAGLHFAPGVHGSFHLIMAWVFVMTWSVLGMEGAACYIGECDNPSRDAKIAMSAEGLYGFFIFVLTAVSLLLVLGIAKNADPLTIFSAYITKIVGSSGSWVEWAIGLPLIFALLMSMLNAIMGCSRSLYQSAEDDILPRWFGRLNQHAAPARAMAFTAVCSIGVVLFGSPLRIYIFSNVGYLFAIALVFYGYFLHRQTKPDIDRPVRLPHAMRWLALAAGIFLTFLWAYGGWNSPSVVIGTKSSSLFLLGLAVMAAYLPLHLWRRFSDRRHPPTVVDVTDVQVGGPGPVDSVGALADRVES